MTPVPIAPRRQGRRPNDEPRMPNLPPKLIGPRRADPLHHEIRSYQDGALDVVGAHDSHAATWRNARIADSNMDACLVEARRCIQRGEYARADHWIAQAQHWDGIEDGLMLRVWAAFANAAEACRIVVRRIELLLGVRRGASACPSPIATQITLEGKTDG